MSALALSTLKLGLRHVNEVFGLSRLRHPGPILGRFPPRFSQVVMRLVAVMLFRIRFLFLALDSFIVIFGALVIEKEFKFYKSHFILRSQLRKSYFFQNCGTFTTNQSKKYQDFERNEIHATGFLK